MHKKFFFIILEMGILFLYFSCKRNSPPTPSEIEITLSPLNITLQTGQQQQFTATITGTSNLGVIYTVNGIVGGNTIVGTITDKGLYTAPNQVPDSGKIIITAISQADTSKRAMATVYIVATVGNISLTADFGNRQSSTMPIPPDMFGFNGGNFGNQTYYALSKLVEAGMTVSRGGGGILSAYAQDSIPDWGAVDSEINARVQAGVKHVIYLLTFTPDWLLPNPDPCNALHINPNHVLPTGAALQTWVKLAVSFVHHFDSTFPGVVQDYEIWNEPNSLQFSCETDTVARLNNYLNLFAAAAPAMLQQAAKDGQTIRVGAPVLGGGKISAWVVPILLSNSKTAPYVGFISYHHYMGAKDQQAYPWYGSSQSLYAETQDTSTGVAATYETFARYVAQGSQPNPDQTPIYITEYNTNSAGQDCCRNDSTYSPLWNTLFIIDLLNTAYQGVAHLPNHLTYFSAGNTNPPTYACLLGDHDAQMDCAYTPGTVPSPYPQLNSYQLIAGSQYLNLAMGGAMAKSITLDPQFKGNATAFFTAQSDDVLILNPTGNDEPQVTILFKNIGFSHGYQLIGYYLQHNVIQNIAGLHPFPYNGGYAVTIDLPAYSVAALQVTGN